MAVGIKHETSGRWMLLITVDENIIKVVKHLDMFTED